MCTLIQIFLWMMKKKSISKKTLRNGCSKNVQPGNALAWKQKKVLLGFLLLSVLRCTEMSFYQEHFLDHGKDLRTGLEQSVIYKLLSTQAAPNTLKHISPLLLPTASGPLLSGATSQRGQVEPSPRFKQALLFIQDPTPAKLFFYFSFLKGLFKCNYWRGNWR